MRADSVARFTLTSCTPGTFFRARSTRITQEAQVMPPTERSSVAAEDVGGDFRFSMGSRLRLHTMARSSPNNSVVPALDIDIVGRFRLQPSFRSNIHPFIHFKESQR
jgi:hypothetical protein